MVYLVVTKSDFVIPHRARENAEIDATNCNGEIVEVTDEEYQKANGMFRVVKGKLIIGLTEQEQQRTATHQRINQIDYEIKAIDEKSIRSSRAIKVAEYANREPDAGDIAKLQTLEEEAVALRSEKTFLNTKLSELNKEIITLLGNKAR